MKRPTLWRLVSVSGLVAGLVAGGALPAFAEGSWKGHLDSVLTGYNSRTWKDAKRDRPVAISLKGCSVASHRGFESVTLQLSRRRSVLPDVNVGRKTYTKCGGRKSQARGWGKPKTGKYRFTVVRINGATSTNQGALWFSTCQSTGCVLVRY